MRGINIQPKSCYGLSQTVLCGSKVNKGVPTAR